MKVRFNKPTKRFTNRFSFDNNTTLGIGNVQPLFCKQLCAGSKFSVSFNQLTRLSPLVVPTFARLKQRNDFVFVPMSMVMPSFDAFLSRSLINGTDASYVPSSVPCTTNVDLFVSLVKNYAYVTYTHGIQPTDKYDKNDLNFKTTYTNKVLISNVLKNATTSPNISDLPMSYWDYVIGKSDFVSEGWSDSTYVCIKLNSQGRFWLSVLRGLGYTLDVNDTTPVSILPLWAFAKAYYDVYYPKRSNPWHASNYYAYINSHYNGHFIKRRVGGLDYDMVADFDYLDSLFGENFSFDFFATIDDSLVTAATSAPINYSSSAGTNLAVFNNTNSAASGQYAPDAIIASNGGQYLSDPKANIPATYSNGEAVATGISADQLRLVERLWSFVQKSSVVGQSVKDWFAVHFGVKPNEDMFDQTMLVDSVINDVSINTVVSTAQTSNGSNGDNLGALAGQGYASKSSSVHFEAKSFGFFMCLTSLVPVSGVSCGTQPELYQNTLYEQQLPDFDGLGYEVVNKSSFMETIVQDNTSRPLVGGSVLGGFGYVPRLSSWKTLHNIRSGNFAVNSVKDSLIPYNVDVLPTQIHTAGPLWRFPWAYHSDFVSFNRMFYNQEPSDWHLDPLPPAPLDDNFMCQTAFDVSYTSCLKPLSDSYSIESLGKDLVSVKEQ